MPKFVSLLRFFCWFFAMCLAGSGIIITSFYLYFSPHLPAVEKLHNLKLETPLRVYTKDQKLIAEFGEKRRSPISIKETPKNLLNAFLAAEDSRFYEHQGVDIKGLLRATVQLASTGTKKSGGSTITMQSARNFFLSQERTFTRKFKEILLAVKIEQELTKDEIFELYLNKIYLGNRAYGVEAAANVYYGSSVDTLTLAQSAMIAGLPKAPSKFNPLASPERALIRRNWILGRMLELSMIDQAAYTEALQAPITASYHGTKPEIEAPYIAEMARQKIVEQFGVDAYTSGMQVILTIDSKMQTAADSALKKGLLDYSRRHGYKGPAAKIDGELLSKSPETALAQIDALPEVSGVIPGIVTEIGKKTAKVITKDEQIVSIDWKGLRWTNPYHSVNRQGKRPKSTKEILNIGDVVYVSQDEEGYKLAQLPEVQGALAALSPSNGAILALVGGFDFYLSKFNRATQARRQPGSNFKPFLYLAALENGATAATMINDAPVVFEDSNLETSWRPENYEEKFYGPTRLRKALYLSRNLVSIRLLQQIGIHKAINFVQKLGFSPDKLPKNLSLALGSADFTPLEVATGYATIANGGFKIKPYLIDKVLDHNGKTVFETTPVRACPECPESSPDSQNTESNAVKEPEDVAAETDELVEDPIAERIADPRSIYIINSILQDVIRRGTGTKAKTLGRNDIAGKTGTTNDQVDAWFSGYNGSIATSVWVGFDQPSTLGRREFGSRAALPVWIDFMKVALEGQPEQTMKQPPGLVTVKIDPITGKRTSTGEDAIFEIFKKETVPTFGRQENSQAENIFSSNSDEEDAPEIIF